MPIHVNYLFSANLAPEFAHVAIDPEVIQGVDFILELPMSELLTNYPVILDWPVQWGDQDALGHVNNTVYFRWCESARIAYLQRLGLGDWMQPTTLGPILAHIDCNYKRQLHFPDTVRIGSRVSQLGRTSITMEHAIVSLTQNALVAESTSVIVVFNYQSQRPCAIPEDVRAAIELLEGKKVESGKQRTEKS